jgi:hypothetical protein
MYITNSSIINQMRALSLFVLLLLATALPSLGQSANQLDAFWAIRGGNTGDHDTADYANSMVRDPNGDFLLRGPVVGSALFGDIPRSSPELSQYIAKYDSSGKALWVQPQPSGMVVGRPVVDSTGNSYRENWQRGGLTLSKYSPSGTALWTKTIIDDTEYDYLDGLGVDRTDNIWLFGQDDDNGGQIISAKFDSSGNQLWRKTYSGNARFSDLAFDPGGNCYFFAYRNDRFGGVSIDFGTLSASTVGKAVFLGKMNAVGEALWLTHAAVDGNLEGKRNSMALDDEGNTYICGSFVGTIAFENITLSSPPWSTYDTWNSAFIAKYGPDGNPLWIKAGLSPNPHHAETIGVDSIGNAYLIITPFTGTKNGSYAYGRPSMLKLDPAGNLVGEKKLFDGQAAYSGGGFSLLLDEAGDIFVSGAFTGDASFGSIKLTSLGTSDMFFAKFSGKSFDTPPAGPLLQIRREGNQLFLSWPASFPGFALERSDQLGPFAAWSAADGQAVVTAQENTVPYQIETGARYFRLKKQ